MGGPDYTYPITYEGNSSMNLHKSKLATFVAALSVVSSPVYGQQAETTSGARHALMEEILIILPDPASAMIEANT